MNRFGSVQLVPLRLILRNWTYLVQNNGTSPDHRMLLKVCFNCLGRLHDKKNVKIWDDIPIRLDPLPPPPPKKFEFENILIAEYPIG